MIDCHVCGKNFYEHGPNTHRNCLKLYDKDQLIKVIEYYWGLYEDTLSDLHDANDRIS